MQRFFGCVTPLRFSEASPEPPVRGMVWGASPATIGTARVEDGFLRSKDLGAKLVPPLSLVLDRSGIYFDPTEPSDLEALIAKRAASPGSGDAGEGCDPEPDPWRCEQI